MVLEKSLFTSRYWHSITLWHFLGELLFSWESYILVYNGWWSCISLVNNDGGLYNFGSANVHGYTGKAGCPSKARSRTKAFHVNTTRRSVPSKHVVTNSFQRRFCCGKERKKAGLMRGLRIHWRFDRLYIELQN